MSDRRIARRIERALRQERERIEAERRRLARRAVIASEATNPAVEAGSVQANRLRRQAGTGHG